MLATGRGKQVHALMYGLAILFVIFLAIVAH